jgi:D-inositol-3-phosphate glycosyltransferase
VPNRKNIILGPAFPLRGGIANFNNALGRAFVKEGVDSQLYSFSLQYPSFLFPGKTQYEEGDAPEGVSIHTLINSINPFNWWSVARRIRKEQPDYIIIRYWLPFMAPCLGSIARLVRRGTNIKVLAITDNIIPHEKRFGDRWLTSYFVKSCDAFVTLSQSVLEELSEFTDCQNKKFIPHPIYNIFGEAVEKQEAILKLGLNPADKHLLFFGFIRKYKGLDLLLEALADERLKEVKLIVAGEFYDNPKEYTDLIARLGIEDQVILRTDYIPGDEVKHYFCAADLVTQTYRTATQSGVTQIGYHFERPMLVTDVGGLAEIIPHEKVGYVTAVSASSIADAIADFYSQEREEEFALNTKEEKKRFSWESLVQAIEAMI